MNSPRNRAATIGVVESNSHIGRNRLLVDWTSPYEILQNLPNVKAAGGRILGSATIHADGFRFGGHKRRNIHIQTYLHENSFGARLIDSVGRCAGDPGQMREPRRLSSFGPPSFPRGRCWEGAGIGGFEMAGRASRDEQPIPGLR